MSKRRFALLALATSGSLLSVASPAHAAAGAMLAPSMFTVAALGLSNPALNCPVATGTPVANLARPEFQSKSRAILSGQESALERMTRQQQGWVPPVEAPLAALSALPSTTSTNCQGFAKPFSAIAPMTEGLRQNAPQSSDFLASRRLPIHSTPLDGPWNRVRRSSLSRGYAQSLVGPVPDSVAFATLARVNAWTNRNVRYVADKAGYGKADHWADARTTLRRRTGDCEDIAIAKMQLLAALGFNRSNMYLTISRDLVRNADHAFLIVRADGRNWLLDDSTDALLDANASHDYRPIMSFSQNQAWLHGYSTLAANVR